MNPIVSVIVTTYNVEQYIREALDSVFSQTYPSLEVLVVDDGSTDRTRTILTEYEPRIRVLAQPNSGVAVARNTGAAASSGSLLAFLDADDIWEPEKTAVQVATFLQFPNLAAAASGARRAGTRAA